MKLTHLLLCVSFCSTIGCSSNESKKSEDTNAPATKEIIPLDLSTCDFKPTEGELAADDMVHHQKLETGSFGKHYYGNWLQSIMKTSGVETAKVVAKTNVKLYKAYGQKKGCPFFHFLEAAPADLQKFWDKSQEEASGSILGLYISRDKTLPTLAHGPGLIMRERTDRYTLVHEFFHHNFSTNHINESGLSDDTLKADLMGFFETIHPLAEEYLKTRSEANAIKYTEAMKQFITNLDMLMVRFTLEEVSIEHILGQKFINGELKYVTKDAHINGGYYIRSSAKKYLSTMDSMLDVVNQVNKAAEIDGKYKAKIEEFFHSIYSQRRAELNVLVQKSYDDGRQLLDRNGLIAKPMGLKPCEHSKAVDSVLVKIKSDFNIQ